MRPGALSRRLLGGLTFRRPFRGGERLGVTLERGFRLLAQKVVRDAVVHQARGCKGDRESHAGNRVDGLMTALIRLGELNGEVRFGKGNELRPIKSTRQDANKRLLPLKTTWVRVDGGDIEQFGFYGAQLGDGEAKFRPQLQQRLTARATIQLMQKCLNLASEI